MSRKEIEAMSLDEIKQEIFGEHPGATLEVTDNTVSVVEKINLSGHVYISVPMLLSERVAWESALKQQRKRQFANPGAAQLAGDGEGLGE